MKDLVYFAEGVPGVPLGTEGAGATLLASTTYYADLADESVINGKRVGSLSSVQFKWDGNIVITSITIETTNFDDSGTLLTEATGTEWYAEGALPVITSAGGGSAQGTRVIHVGDNGAARMRAKIIVGGTGGNLRGRIHYKR